jgi:hypothetical protein
MKFWKVNSSLVGEQFFMYVGENVYDFRKSDRRIFTILLLRTLVIETVLERFLFFFIAYKDFISEMKISSLHRKISYQEF